MQPQFDFADSVLLCTVFPLAFRFHACHPQRDKPRRQYITSPDGYNDKILYQFRGIPEIHFIQ